MVTCQARSGANRDLSSQGPINASRIKSPTLQLQRADLDRELQHPQDLIDVRNSITRN